MSLLNASSVGHASKPYGRPYDHEASLGQFVLLTDLPRARSVDNMNVASVADIHASVHGGSVCLLSAPPLHSFARRSLQSHETTGATISRPRCALIAARTALTSSMQQAELTHSGQYRVLLHQHHNIAVASAPQSSLSHLQKVSVTILSQT